MTVNNSENFKKFSEEFVKLQGDDVRRWAKQNENPLLKKLALEVLEIVGYKQGEQNNESNPMNYVKSNGGHGASYE